MLNKLINIKLNLFLFFLLNFPNLKSYDVGYFEGFALNYIIHNTFSDENMSKFRIGYTIFDIIKNKFLKNKINNLNNIGKKTKNLAKQFDFIKSQLDKKKKLSRWNR